MSPLKAKIGHHVPIFARSMKQKRYNNDIVGMMYKSIFKRSLASTCGSNCNSDWPYLWWTSANFSHWKGDKLLRSLGFFLLAYLSVARWPRSAISWAVATWYRPFSSGKCIPESESIRFSRLNIPRSSTKGNTGTVSDWMSLALWNL